MSAATASAHDAPSDCTDLMSLVHDAFGPYRQCVECDLIFEYDGTPFGYPATHDNPKGRPAP